MTLDLILIRHAKSSWGDPLITDHDRQLNKRGEKSADAIGAWLKVHDALPTSVLCSTARRAVDTWVKLSPHIGGNATVDLRSDLYHAEPRTMLDVLRSAKGACVLMVGHNPGIGLLAAGLCKAPSLHPDFNRYPTCATTWFRFDHTDWSAVAAGSGDIVDFIVPRQLLGK